MNNTDNEFLCTNSKQGFIAFALLIFVSLLFFQADVTEAAPYIERVSGTDRIDTAIQISKTGWDVANTVILARADNPADALSSASLSGKMDAPILLTYPTSLKQSVIDEMKRLGASKVYILGGTGAVSDNIAAQLKKLGLTVKRLGGKTRFDTASIINNEAQTSFNEKAILVSGYAAADALSAASNSANNLIPIYLSTKTTIPVNLPANVKEVTIYGGTGVIGSEVESLLVEKGIKVSRISGATRYETNINATDETLTDNVIIVRGTSTKAGIEDYPDAVTGAGLSHKLGANIVLVNPIVSVQTVADYFKTHRYPNVFVLGGEGAVSDAVVYNYLMLPDTTVNKVFDFTPVATDEEPSNPIMYFLDAEEQTIKSYNYETKEFKSLNLSGKPEDLYVHNNKIYITLVDQVHSSSWTTENQTGQICIVNAETFQIENTYDIRLDPFDIVVDSNGVMYVSGGSGQSTLIKSVSSETGEEISSMSIRQQSYIEINPNQSLIYAITTDSFPRNITQFSISNGKLISSQSNPDPGNYKLNVFMKISPDGSHLFNNGGYVFNHDLTYAGELQVPYAGLTFDLAQNRFFTALSDIVFEHDYSAPSFGIYNYYLTNGDVQQIYYKNDKLIVLSQIADSSTGMDKFALETMDLGIPNVEHPLSKKQLNTLVKK